MTQTSGTAHAERPRGGSHERNPEHRFSRPRAQARVLDRHDLQDLCAARMRCAGPRGRATVQRRDSQPPPAGAGAVGDPLRGAARDAHAARDCALHGRLFHRQHPDPGPGRDLAGRARCRAVAGRLRHLRQHAPVRAALRRRLRGDRAQAARGPSQERRARHRAADRDDGVRSGRRRAPDDQHDPNAQRRGRHAAARIGRRRRVERGEHPGRGAAVAAGVRRRREAGPQRGLCSYVSHCSARRASGS